MAGGNNIALRHWADDHLGHVCWMTESAFPFPKRVGPRRPDGGLRPSFALHAFVAALEGSTLQHVTDEGKRLAAGGDDGANARREHRDAVARAIARLGVAADADEVLDVVATVRGGRMRDMAMEVAWAHSYGWAKLDGG